MNDRTEREQLDRVLNAYALSVESPSHASLVEWIRRYPEYERELTELAVDLSRMEHQPSASRSPGVDDDTLVLRGMSIFRNIVHRKATERSAATHLNGIVATAQGRGLTLDVVAERLKLSAALVRMLDLRRIAYTRIPGQLKESMAQLVGCTRVAVDEYLQRAPSFAPAAQHHADQPPSVGVQEDFFDAVREEDNMDEEQRRHWLDLEPKGDMPEGGKLA